MNRRLPLLFAAAFIALPLRAQTTITYTNGENNTDGIQIYAGTVILEVDAGTATQSGMINGGGLNSDGGMSKTGAGTLILAHANDYNGLTTVEAGTLRAGAVEAFAEGFYTIDAGATLDLNGFDTYLLGFDGGAGTIALGSATLTIDQSFGAPFSGKIPAQAVSSNRARPP